MLTSNIEMYADIGGIASPDINLKVLLRRNVVPAYFQDVGYPSWRRRSASQVLLVGDAGKQFDLPEDFGLMQSVAINPSQPLDYIGEDPEKVMAAEAATASGAPTGYYLVRRVTTQVFKRLALNCPPAAADVLRYSYYSHVAFPDDTTEIEMDKHVPAQFQWALVEGLKMQIMWVRFGIGDPRYVAAEQSYRMWVERAMENPELARRNNPIFVR